MQNKQLLGRDSLRAPALLRASFARGPKQADDAPATPPGLGARPARVNHMPCLMIPFWSDGLSWASTPWERISSH